MPPASAVNNSSSNAAMQAAAKAEREEKLRGALKVFILKERQRKQEEYEAKCEEIRVRKEREARERENDMTLEDTRGQISKLDEKLTDLHNQKQQLFLQLKKVLNEDENRKKLQKDNELFALQQHALHANIIPAQVFLPQPIGNQPIKRGRSPSPTQGFYKATATFGQAKHDEGRRGADYARVLWNKPVNQYPNTGTLFYQTAGTVPTTQADARLQPLYPYQLPLRTGYHLELTPTQPPVPVSKADSPAQKQPTQVFHIMDQPSISQAEVVGVSTSTSTIPKQQITMEKINDRYQIELKHDATTTGHVLGIPHGAEGVIYKPIIGDLPLQQNVLQIATNLAQNPKSTGSITQGYAPGRGTQHEQQMARQQISVLPGQTTQQANQQQLHYTRRLY